MTKTLLGLLVATASVLALGACTPAPASTSTSTATTTAPAGATPTSDITPGASSTITVAPSATAPTGTASASTPDRTPATSVPASRAATTVDAAGFLGEGGRYFFAAPSGDILCASGGGFVVGCQSRATIPTVRDCPAGPSKSPYVALADIGEPKAGCTTQGLFMTASPKTLGDGQTIEVAGKFRCTSAQGAIECERLTTPAVFSISKDAISIG